MNWHGWTIAARAACLSVPSVFAASFTLLAAGLTTTNSAQAQSCARGDFEAVVDEAAESLRVLNSRNKPEFQNLLRVLRVKHKWSHDDFLREAAPFVQDEKIDSYNQRSQELLSEIANLGEAGSNAANPDCSLLEKLRERMRVLVEAQTAKWQYMFDKLQKEIDK